jgi:hypothetical protein
MKKIIILSAIVANCTIAFAQQTATDAIKQTITTLFDGMRKSDSTMIRSAFAKGMAFHSVAIKKDGSTELVNVDPGVFIKRIVAPHQGVYDERVTFSDIKIDGNLASVWAPYKFYISDKFSHCGVDIFQLMKTAGGWKIIYIVDTERKDGCLVD